MDKAIFEFDSLFYERATVEGFSRELCEHLTNTDADNVTKYNLGNGTLQNILNSNMLDVDNMFYRVFI